VARGVRADDAPAVFSVPAHLLRAGRNAMALEGFSAGAPAPEPSLELLLVSPGVR
jgi:hypothetical protein